MNYLKPAGRLALHTLWVLLVIIMSGMVISALTRIPGIDAYRKEILTFLSVPPYPVLLVSSLLTGFVAARKYRHKEACWVFVLPCIWFAMALLANVRGAESVLAEPVSPFAIFFNRSPVDRAGLMYPLLFTLPMLAALSYSVGAFLSLRLKFAAKHEGAINRASGEQLEP